MYQITKEMVLEMDLLMSRMLLQKDSGYKFQFCTEVCQGWSLEFKSRDDWVKYGT